MGDLSGYALWIDGCHVATQITPGAGHSPPTWETLADGGCGELTTTLYLRPHQTHHALTPGARVTLRYAGLNLYSGFLRDYDQQTGDLVAQGWFSRQKRALDESGNATLNVATAIAQAQSRGWHVRNTLGVGGVVAGEVGEPLVMSELLTRRAEELGMRPGVDADRRVYIRPDPTTPDWMLAPGAAVLGSTGEGAPTALIGRYFDGTNNQTLLWGDTSGEEDLADLTERGTLTAIQAGAILGGALALSTAQRAWVNGITVSEGQIMSTVGGTKAALMTVRAGQMLRLTGLPVLAAGSLWVDAVIGKTTYTAGARTITLEPVNTAPRDFASVLAAA